MVSQAESQKTLIDLLEKGPWIGEDLESELGLDRYNLHTVIDKARRLLNKSGRTIRRDKGRQGKIDVYAIRNLGGES
ncbi:MAG: hypothetical protein KAV87_13660 [Desulfobacteraceae bacterium]|nr:hypothetical protein [Desulfobacteraceae bacterium]